MTGKIEGLIVDEKGASIPDVVILVSSPVLQGMRTTQTDASGFFRFILLPTGLYTAKITHVAFRPVTIDNIQVRLGNTAFLDSIVLTANPYELKEIVIRNKRNLIDPNSTVSGGNFTKNEIETLPLQRNYRYIPLLLPQINISYYGDKFSNSGATGIENRYLIDGVEVAEPVWMWVSQDINLPYNFIKDIEVLTGGYEAQYRSSLGSIINIVTPSGGDKISGQLFGFYTDKRFAAKSNSIPGENFNEGNFSLYDFGVSIGGPLIKEKLWFNAAYNPNFQNEDVLIPGIGIKTDKLVSNQIAGKLSWHPSDKIQLILNFTGEFFNNDRVWVSVPSGIENYINPDPSLTMLKWQHYSPFIRGLYFFSDKFLLEGSVSRYQRNDSNLPVTMTGKNPAFYDYQNGTVSGGIDNTYTETTVRYDLSLKATLSLNDHIIKAGFEYLNNSLDINRYYHTVERFTDSLYYYYMVDVDGKVGNIIPAVFLQDLWRINDKWQINAGLRWEGQYIISSDGRIAQKIQDQFQPRIGIIFSPDQKGGDKFFISYGRFYQELANIGLPYYYLEDFDAVYRSYNHDPRQNISGGDTLYALTGKIQEEIPGFKGQYIDKFYLGYERRILENYKFSIQGIYHTLREGMEDSYSKERKMFVLGNPGRYPLSDYPRLKRDYIALELTFQKTPGDPFNFFVSYVVSRNFGNYQGLFESEKGLPGANISGAFEYPETTENATGLLPYDRTHSFKFYTSYWFDFGLTLGAVFSWMSGTPLNEFGIGPHGYERIFLQSRGTVGRTSPVWDLNLRFAYLLPQILKYDYHVRFILDVFHVASRKKAVNYDQLHYFNIDQNGAQIDPNPTYNLPTSFQPPMSFRFGFEISF